LVSAAPPPSGVTIEEMVDVAAEPGPFLFTRAEEEEEHISTGFVIYDCMRERRGGQKLIGRDFCEKFV
jgi:hypothetical protein